VKVRDETVMQFYDGELDSERAREVRVGLLVEPDVNRELETLSTLGSAVRAWATQAGIDACGERRRRARARARRRVLGACSLCVLSALAAPMLMPPQGRAGSDDETGASDRSQRGEPVVAIGPVAVETVDFGARPGAIFRVAGDASSETTVVWLPDEPQDSL
jgi:hypothetical protein